MSTPTTSVIREHLQVLAEMQEKMVVLNKAALAGKPLSAELRAIVLPTLSLERLVLDMGTEFASQPLTTAEKAMAMHAKVVVGPRYKECFRVAQQAVQLLRGDGKTVEYVEGVAYSGVLPVHHAWFTLSGKVVDLTWRRDKYGKVNDHGQQFVLGTFDKSWAYMGITIPNRLVMASQLDTGHYTSVLTKKVVAELRK